MESQSKSQIRGYSAQKFDIHQVEFVLLCMTGLQQPSQTTVRMNDILEFVIYSSATRLLVRGGVLQLECVADWLSFSPLWRLQKTHLQPDCTFHLIFLVLL